MVTVQRVNGTVGTFEAADVLRIRRAVVPLSRDETPAVAIDVVGDEATIYTRESFDEILRRLEAKANLVEFTDPEGAPVAINAGRVSEIRPNGRQEAGDARTVLIIGRLRQAIQEPRITAATLIAGATGRQETP